MWPCVPLPTGLLLLAAALTTWRILGLALAAPLVATNAMPIADIEAREDLSSVLSGLDLPSIQDVLDTGLTVLVELITTLQNGQLFQNDLLALIDNSTAVTTNSSGSAQQIQTDEEDEDEDEDADDDDSGDNDSSIATAIDKLTSSHGQTAKVSAQTTQHQFRRPSARFANGTCPTVAVLFARGTNEPGNVGFLTGPPFFTALQNYLNDTSASLALQGVDYKASAGGFLAGGSSLGAVRMAAIANRTVAACPDARLVMAGYSQGAQVVRKAMGILSGHGGQLAGNGTSTGGASASAPTTATAASAKAISAISSVVLFGDPHNGTAVPGVDQGRVMVACHAGDNICAGGDLVLPPHLNYSSDAPAAAMFVMQRSQLGLASDDAMMQGMGNVPTMQNPKAAT